MFNGKKYIESLNDRIALLEELACAEGHQFRDIKTEFSYEGQSVGCYVKQVCIKCGKVKTIRK